jgi:hypothetical protein
MVGAGSFGSVFKALDTAYANRSVAIKVSSSLAFRLGARCWLCTRALNDTIPLTVFVSVWLQVISLPETSASNQLKQLKRIATEVCAFVAHRTGRG